MSRSKIELSSELQHEITQRTLRGESADTIFAAIIPPFSLNTLRRIQAEIRSNTYSRSGNPEPTPAIPEEIPENATQEELDRWLARLEKAAQSSEARGDIGGLASIASKVTALMALKHRSAPIPKHDPNTDPDFIKLAKQGREKLLALVRTIR